MSPARLRIARDDPEYVRAAAAEAEFWARMHPWGLESLERKETPGPVDRYFNRRFTGDESVHWSETCARHGRFRRGAILGTSSLRLEARILETNPDLRVTFFDLAEGALERRRDDLGKRFPGRVDTRVADLNFLELEPGGYDLIASSSTIHHVTNLEHLAAQIGRALTAEGLFFLEDYVGERRFSFAPEKKRIYQHVINRDRGRHGLPRCDLVWLDTADLSPFCGVRSDDILSVFRDHLDEVEVRTAGTLLTPLTRSRPAEDVAHSPWRSDDWVLRQPRWRLLLGIARNRFPRLLGRHRSQQNLLSPELLQELFLIGDVLAELDLIRPGIAFAIYRKRA
jgi:SAM-dependent methyltransferase